MHLVFLQWCVRLLAISCPQVAEDCRRCQLCRVCLIRWPASRVALVRRSSEALTGRAEVPAPPPQDAPPPTPVQQVSSQIALLLLLTLVVSVQDDVLMD
jgi:hypothetical protein